MTDEDLAAFLARCRASLAQPRGVLIIKDNVVEADTDEVLEDGAFLVDREDNSVIRTRPYLERLLERCGFEVLQRSQAVLDCDELHPVFMYALR